MAYDDVKQLWACCGKVDSGDIDCKNPSDELYPGPAPSDLVPIQSLPSTGSVSGPLTYLTASSSISATAPASATTTATDTAADSSSSAKQPSSDGVSAGAAAGIGVGVGLGVILIGAAAAFVFFRKRATKAGPSVQYSGYNGGQESGVRTSSGLGRDMGYKHELDTNPSRPAELDIVR